MIDLYRSSKVARIKFGHHYVYFSKEHIEEQLKKRVELEPKGSIKLEYKDIKNAVLKVGEKVKSIVNSSLESLGMQKNKIFPTDDIVIAGLIKPLKKIRSNRALSLWLL